MGGRGGYRWRYVGGRGGVLYGVRDKSVSPKNTKQVWERGTHWACADVWILVSRTQGGQFCALLIVYMVSRILIAKKKRWALAARASTHGAKLPSKISETNFLET